jgi:anti-sigma regulatory factor (Ser/Thr protein kinase)
MFKGKVDDLAARQFSAAIREAHERGTAGFTLNFYDVERAYPDAMLRIISQVDRFRRHRLSFNILTPEDRRLNGLFRNANWAHLLAPSMYPASETASDRHLPALRYTSGEDHKRIVDATLEILLRAMKLDRQVLDGLEWSLNEITDNVLNHADAPDGGIVQLTTLREHQQVKFVVADAGRGIPASMREGHPELRLDIDAIGEAIKQGVTRSPDEGQGNGLAGALRIATLSGGSFRVTSGRGELVAGPPPTPRNTGRGFRVVPRTRRCVGPASASKFTPLRGSTSTRPSTSRVGIPGSITSMLST